MLLLSLINVAERIDANLLDIEVRNRLKDLTKAVYDKKMEKDLI